MKTPTTKTKKAKAKAEIPASAEAAKVAKAEAPATAEKPAPRMMDDMWSTEVASSPTAKKSKSTKDVVDVPADLKMEHAIAVSGKRVIKAMGDKVDLAVMRLKRFAVRRWARAFVRTGVLPPSAQLVDGSASIDFIPTKRINLKAEKVDALKMLGVQIDQHLEFEGVTIDFGALEKHGLLEQFKTAIQSLPGMNPKIFGEIVQKNIVVKETLYPSMAKLARESLPPNSSEDEVVDRMEVITDIVNPVSQIRNPQDAERDLGDAIEVVATSELTPTADESDKLKSKKFFGGGDE